MISSIWPPSSSPVPRMMARLILSAGMLAALASVTALRRRGFMSASPPPERAAIMISLIMRVKAFPRLASVAAFLCLMVAHLECPDMVKTSSSRELNRFAGEPNRLEYHAKRSGPDWAKIGEGYHVALHCAGFAACLPDQSLRARAEGAG